MVLTDVTLNGWYIASIIMGVIIIGVSFATFIVPHRRINLILRLSFDILNIINCIFIYFATGVQAILVSLACDAISVVRDIIFYNRKKGNAIDKIYWPIGFDIIFGLSLIWTWSGPITLLPVIGNIINTTALYIYRKKVTRIVTLVGEVLFIVYSALLIPSSSFLTIFNLISSSAMFISALAGLIVLSARDKKREEKNI